MSDFILSCPENVQFQKITGGIFISKTKFHFFKDKCTISYLELNISDIKRYFSYLYY